MDENRRRGGFSHWLDRVWRRGVMRSGIVTWLVLSIAALTFVLVYLQHMQGNFHKLKQRMADERPQATEQLPGGQESIELTRTRMMEDAVPEFLSMTMLPGRGMDVLDLRAFIPGTGEIRLLTSPTVQEAATAMTGKGADADGRFNLKTGGAIELPWADGMWGTTTDGHTHPQLTWQGHTMGGTTSTEVPWEGGLILATASDSSNTSPLPDGGQAEATFHGFNGRWPSTTEVTTSALLSSHTIDLTVTANNAGNEAEPVGIGWRPRLAIPADARAHLRIHIAGESVVEQNKRQNGIPTGTLVPVAHTRLDFTSPEGALLPEGGLDVCFTELTQGVMDDGPTAELINPVDGYKLRITALSPEIKAIRVTMPADGSYIAIGPQYNYPDPFGHEWDKAGGAGMVTLQPGQSTKWKVRLEILPLNKKSVAH